jgi:hypothetical protein
MDLLSSISATAIFHYVLPYLKAAGESTAKKAGEGVFEWLKEKLTVDRDGSEALKRLSADPDDRENADRVERSLTLLLEKDSRLQDELRSFLAVQRNSPAAEVTIRQNAADNATQIGQIHGDVTFGKTK